ncbi:hypothetical protein [Paraburkholderia jirisanensis]
MNIVNVPLGGIYATDNLTASRYLVQQLTTDSSLDPQQRAQQMLWLGDALKTLRQSPGTAQKSEIDQVYEQALKIPGFKEFLGATVSPSSLPGTVAAGAASLHSLAQAKPVSDLLDLPPNVQKQLLQWANKGGNQGIKSAQKKLGNAIKITKVEGKFVFEIPKGETAKAFILRGQTAEDVIRIPAYRALAQDALQSRNAISVSGYGATRIGGILSSAKVGAALAFGPQMALDGIDSHSFSQWVSLEAHHQPGNAAAWLTGLGVTATGVALGLSAPIVIPAALILGAGAAVVVTIFGVDTWIGDHVDHWIGYRR